MKHLKKRWSKEAETERTVSAQNLADNAGRFMLEAVMLHGLGQNQEVSPVNAHMEWTTEKKVRWIEIDTEERAEEQDS